MCSLPLLWWDCLEWSSVVTVRTTLKNKLPELAEENDNREDLNIRRLLRFSRHEDPPDEVLREAALHSDNGKYYRRQWPIFMRF